MRAVADLWIFLVLRRLLSFLQIQPWHNRSSVSVTTLIDTLARGSVRIVLSCVVGRRRCFLLQMRDLVLRNGIDEQRCRSVTTLCCLIRHICASETSELFEQTRVFLYAANAN